MVRINTNVAALTANRSLGLVSDSLAGSTQKLSSGLRINASKDDAAGLIISEKLRAQIRATEQAARNALDGVSMIQIGEGSLDNVHLSLQRLRELAVQASNGTINLEQRTAITNEANQVLDNIDRIATTTRYAQFTLFGESPSKTVNLQIGGNSGERLAVEFSDMQTPALGIDTISLDTPEDSNQTIVAIDAAIDAVSSQRATLGGAQNALEAVVGTLNAAVENLHASESRIRDLDIAGETVSFTRWQILSQSATAVLAQANVFPQNVLQLLRQ
ncbi:MAG: flagellin FliC [Chloroflexi bacterium]|nr:flagellin FliC [Chloroflexota bacterium]